MRSSHIGCVLFFCALIALAFAPAGAAAPPENATNTTAPEESCEQLDPVTDLCSIEYDQDRGVIVLELRSETTQRATIVDAGKFVAGGKVPRKRVTLEPGRTTLTISGTLENGMRGVSIATAQSLNARWLEKEEPGMFPGEPSLMDTFTTALLAVVSVTVSGVLAVVWYRRQEGGVRDVF